jgi:hypothetical protein
MKCSPCNNYSYPASLKLDNGESGYRGDKMITDEWCNLFEALIKKHNVIPNVNSLLEQSCNM